MAAGLRRGVIEGRVAAVEQGAGCRVEIEVARSTFVLNWTAVLVLALGAVGGILVMLWPLFPALLPLAPIGALMGLSAWLLVAARLRSSSPQDYLNDLASSLDVADPEQAR